MRQSSLHAFLALIIVMASSVEVLAKKSATERSVKNSFDFQGSPVRAVADYLCQLTEDTVLLPEYASGQFYYKSSPDVTKADALRELEEGFQSNGWKVVHGKGYLKVLRSGESTNEVARVEIHIGENARVVLVDKQPVSVDELAEYLKDSAQPVGEAWIFDSPWNDEDPRVAVMTQVGMAKLKPCRVFLASKARLWQKTSLK